jgi:Ca2+/Na+ antiporter
MVKKSRVMTKEKANKLFLTFLDSIILLSFGLSVYFTLIQDYMRTILFLVLGTLLLMFFIVRGIIKTTKLKI